MTSDTLNRYRKLRRENPFLSASYILSWAKTANPKDQWEEDGHDSYKRTVKGFTVKLHIEEESIFPAPNKHGDTDYGRYVDEISRDYSYDWDGNWPAPAEDAPLGIPYTSIRYSGPGWVQGEKGGYFIPEHIEEQFDYYRRQGQSKQVAWDLTKEWVEAQIAMLFHSPLTNVVVVLTAEKEDIELASASMGTDVDGDDMDYVFQMIEEHGMIDDLLEDAKAAIDKLTTA